MAVAVTAGVPMAEADSTPTAAMDEVPVIVEDPTAAVDSTPDAT